MEDTPLRLWALYVKHRPGIERFPGSYLRPIVNAAERGDANAIQLLKDLRVWDSLQEVASLERSVDTSGEPA